VLHFEGVVTADTIEGSWHGGFGDAPCTGRRGGESAAAGEDVIPDLHDRPIIEQDGKQLLWAGEDDAGNVDWFDMTDSTIDPALFQFGIGKDTIDSIDTPRFVRPDDPLLAERGVNGETEVLGVEIGGVARAYPVDVMSIHEIVNDEFHGDPYAVLW